MEISFFLLVENVAFAMAEDFPWGVGLKTTMQPGKHLFQNDGAPAGLLLFCHEVVTSVKLRDQQIV